MLIVSEWTSETLSVNIAPPATVFHPLEGRKYTLSQSEYTGKLFLSISNQFSKQTNDLDVSEILQAEWITLMGEYALNGNISMNGSESDRRLTQVRCMIFQKELPELIRMLVIADNQFFNNYPLLLDAPIIIHFNTDIPEFSGTFQLGTPRQYLLKPIVTST
nr:staygreen family protein [Heyndrickxia shackletonii]